MPYGSWELLRPGKDVAILGVGTMVQPASAPPTCSPPKGVDCSRGQLPLPQAAGHAPCWRRWCSDHRILVTVEEGTVVNGFGAYLAEVLQTTHPEVRVIALGVPDRLIEQAPRAEQLERFGLTGRGHRPAGPGAARRGVGRGAMNVGVVGNPRYPELGAARASRGHGAGPRVSTLFAEPGARARLWQREMPADWTVPPSTCCSPSAATAPCCAAPAC